MPNTFFISFIVLISTTLLVVSVNAQTEGINDTSGVSDSCECTPICAPPEKGACKHVGPRSDCPCCSVCLGREGDSCSNPEMPCDERAGFTCSSKGTCQDIYEDYPETQVEGFEDCKTREGTNGLCRQLSDCPEVLSTIATRTPKICRFTGKHEASICCPVKTKMKTKCKTDNDCTDDLFCVQDTCMDPCPILQPCHGMLQGGVCVTKKHVPKCECPSGSKRSLEENRCIASEPKTLSPRNVSIPSSSTGCRLNGMRYKLGEIFYSEGCNQRCLCGPNGKKLCGSFSCPTGLVLAGSSKSTDCVEHRENNLQSDKCCVVLTCLQDFIEDTLSEATKAEVEALAVDNSEPEPEPVIENNLEETLSEATIDELESENFKDNIVPTTTESPDNMMGEENLKTSKQSMLDTVTTSSVSSMETSSSKPIFSNITEHRFAIERNNTNKTESPEDVAMLEKDMVVVSSTERSTGNSSSSDYVLTTVPTRLFIEKEQAMMDDKMKPDSMHVKFSTKSSMLQLKAVTQNTSTIEVPSMSGGILHYKESRADIKSSKVNVEDGQKEVLIENLNPSTRYTLKWAGNDGKSAKTEIKTEDGCRHAGISYPVEAKWNEDCQTTCSCHIGGVSECKPRCLFLAGAITDDQCIERPSPVDPKCCVEYDCAKGDNSVLDWPLAPNDNLESTLEKPNLIVTARSHNSVTVAWDDFRDDNPNNGYVTEYREADPISIEIPWRKIETSRGQPPPTMTIPYLKPNSMYEVRVGISNEANKRKFIAATETITVRTEPGCVYGNTSFPVGEFFEGCEERCSCAKDGSVKCSERCSIPYFRRGSFAKDPLCVEEATDEDECCVLVMCAHGENLSGKETVDYDQCANTVCGKNAECVSWPTLTDATDVHSIQPGSCHCIDGFQGDPNDLVIGCTTDFESRNEANSCKFKSSFYSPGDVFFDGCSYTCTCNTHREIECQPRCKYSSTNKMSDNSSCTYEADPNDSCCEIRNCNSTMDETEDLASPSLTFDGCTYGNESYAKDQEFTFGCDSKCLCMGFGDVSCYPRCPPTKDMTEKEGVKCETLLDPEDECCNVTVCDSVAPEVMKEGVQGDENEAMSVLITEMPSKAELTTETSMNETSTQSGMEETTTMDAMKRPRFEDPELPSIEIVDISPVNSSLVNMRLHVTNDILQKFLSSPSEYLEVSYSHDSLQWMTKNISVDEVEVQDMYYLTFTIPNLEAHDNYQFRVNYDGISSQNRKVSLMTSAIMTESRSIPTDKCEFQGKYYSSGETFYDGCKQFCQCNPTYEVHCGMIECPRDFGLDLLDPGCLEWEDDPEYVAVPPKCCGQKPKCSLHIDHLSCTHMGHNFKHLDFIPKEMVGCDQRCQCISGDLDCETLCAPVQATPPFHLPCPPIQIRLVTIPTFPCCREWQCSNMSDPNLIQVHPQPPGGIFPSEHGFHINRPGPPSPPQGISMPIIEDVQKNTVTITFSIPNTFVGLPGGIYLRYTPDVLSNPNPLDWESEVIHEDGVTLDQPQWRYTKQKLYSGTNYSMQVTLSSHLAKTEIVSPIVTVVTVPDSFEPNTLEIDPDLSVSDITNTSAMISWRQFTHDESLFIDAIQIRYWPKNIQIPHKGPLLHLDADSMILMGLKPNTQYLVDLIIVMHVNSPVLLTTKQNLSFKTLPSDMDKDLLAKLELDAELSASDIKNTSAKISWKHFTQIERKYIDGIRVRFWSGTKRFPQEGPMLHREADNMILKDLQPDIKYTVDLFFIPHQGLTSTISNTKNITFTTKSKLKDMYAFNISITAGEISDKGVQVLYSGISEPEGKYVNVYRIVYTTDGDFQDSQKFKVPKNRENGYIMLTNLRQGIEYEIWLEAYLTNGDKKKSNVISVKTDFDGNDDPAINEIAETKELKQGSSGNYYSAFVALVILVVIAGLTIIGLLFVMMRRMNHAKANINSAGKGGNNAAYDNPSYKTAENPSYAMEMNGLKNPTNGSSIANEEL